MYGLAPAAANGWPLSHRIATKYGPNRSILQEMALFSRLSTHRKVARLIRNGVGVREASWPLDGYAPEVKDQLVASVIEWVRSSMGEMRRPYGIDHVALALAARDEAGRVLCSNSLGVLRPASFYADDGAKQVLAFLGDAERVMRGAPGEMVGALLSLGDIAFELKSRAA